jgi:hypothetical protein
VENDVDINVTVTTVPPMIEQQGFGEFRPQLLDESCFMFPLKQVKYRKFLVFKDVV